jgi:glutaminyl-peptide cyclotransferase
VARAAFALVSLVVILAAPAAGANGRGRFDERQAFTFLRWQVALGPRPAGSAPSRRLAARLVRLLPGARYQAVPGGLRNVLFTVRGRDPKRVVVLGAHYDTKDLPDFVGANDGASGTAVVFQLARTLRPRTVRPTVVFAFFDGEESPDGTDFESGGMRGSKVAARTYRHAEAMILLDMIGDRDLRISREAGSDRRLWTRVESAARRTGHGGVFADDLHATILDDHVPFARLGVPSIDLIDFDFRCWHKTCDDLSAVLPRSLDAVGETVRSFLASD